MTDEDLCREEAKFYPLSPATHCLRQVEKFRADGIEVQVVKQGHTWTLWTATPGTPMFPPPEGK